MVADEQGWRTRGMETSIPAQFAAEPAGQALVEPGPTASQKPVVRTRVRPAMTLHKNHRNVLNLLERFGQLTVGQIDATIFSRHRSPTSAKDCVKALYDRGLIKRHEIRQIGGSNGGSGQFVYQAKTRRWTAIHQHELAIGDVYVSLYRAQDDTFKLVRFENEPHTHRRINYIPLTPDFFAVIDLGSDVELHAWFEVDLGSEGPGDLREKMDRYHHAFSGASDRQRREWPLVVWVVPDEERRAELESLVQKQPAESRGMYLVCLFDDVVETLRNAQ